jgi:hypothetical protein
MKYNKLIKITLILFVLFLSSCEDFDTELDKEFTEDPTPSEVVSEETAKQIYHGWFQTVNNYDGPALAMTTAADMNTCSWGNAGMRDLSSEPRVAWNNSTGYSYKKVTTNYFSQLYALLFDSNNLVKGLEDGSIETENFERTKCLAHFGQAATLGYLALVFDKVWISDETGTLNNGEPVSYTDAMNLALTKLDQAIDLASNNSFTLDDSFILGQNLSSADFAKYLNSFAARLIVNNVRNSTQRDAIDWNKVLAYANNGLDYDFMVTGDGYETWYNEWIIYAVYPGWARVDMRVINLMDPNTTDYWDDPNPTLPPATSADARLITDFEYLSGNNFIPSRGIYHFSNYRFSRYDNDLHGNNWLGTTPEMLKAENDLYKAEALLRLNQLSDAAAVINSSTRVQRGNLAPVLNDATQIADAIHYERSIELLETSVGLGFFEMRRENLLQEGTILHFPVPGEALEAAGLPIYTFGGTEGVAGEDYSAGGWR